MGRKSETPERVVSYSSTEASDRPAAYKSSVNAIANFALGDIETNGNGSQVNKPGMYKVPYFRWWNGGKKYFG